MRKSVNVVAAVDIITMTKSMNTTMMKNAAVVAAVNITIMNIKLMSIIITMRKDILVEIMKRDILVEAAAVADADHTLQWKERMLERNAVHITKEHSMTELSLILLMTVESRLSSYVVQDR